MAYPNRSPGNKYLKKRIRASTSLLPELGQREREVLSVLWAQGSGNVQQVADRLSTTLAYTTVMTTLDRLFKKGLLQREKRNRAFIYYPNLTAQEIEAQRALSLVSRFFSDSCERSDILLSCLIEAVDHYDIGMLDQLESKIRSARAHSLKSNSEPDGGS